MDNIRVKEESLNNWRSDVNVDEGWKLAAGAAALAVPYLAKKFLKPKVDGAIEKARNSKSKIHVGGNIKSGIVTESYNTSDWRNEFHPTEIESIDIIKNKPLVNERYKFIGPGKGKKARDEDMTKHKGEKLGPNYLIPQASINKEKEVVSASYEADLENLIVEILEADIEAMYEHRSDPHPYHQEGIEFYCYSYL